MQLKITVFLLLILSFHLQSQERCGFDRLHRKQMIENPSYAQSLAVFEKNLIDNYANFKTKANGSYKIPLVIHVLETKTAMSEITDEQIYAAIQGLNEAYRKVSGTHGDGNGVDVNIEFVLSVRDPQGNCTSGITRRDMTSDLKYMTAGTTSNSDGISDSYLKKLDVWNQKNYYNIWLVSEIDGNNGGSGTQGYAYFASSHGLSNDGAVILVNAIKKNNDHTLPHELGHALNLYHTFEGDLDNKGNSICPSNSNCTTTGDLVCDTPPHKRSKSNCNDTLNACDNNSSSTLFIHNYMDYSSSVCANMFTSGQKTRMIAALIKTRASFLEENGNLSLKPVSSPSIDFISSNSVVCAGSFVQLKSRTSCIPNSQLITSSWTNITFQWTLSNGNTELTSALENPIFQLNEQGMYTITLEVTSSFGSQSFTKKGSIIVVAPSKNACIPTSLNEGNYWNCITNVTLNNLDNSTSIYTNVAYSDFSCTHSTILEIGKTYDFTVSIRAAANPEVFEAFIDYNNNGIFETEEKIHAGFTPKDTVNMIISPVKTTITVPQNAVTNTPLRMRVYGEANTLNTSEKNCSSKLFLGDVEDYTVYIKPACKSPIITQQPTTPSGTCSGTSTQNLQVLATGNNLTYQWRKNGINISDNSIYSGVNTNNLTLTNANYNQSGNYDVLISGTCDVSSSIVPVTIDSFIKPTLTCGVSTDESITFEWLAIPGITNYGISYNIDTSQFIELGNTNELSYTLNNLTKNSLVKFKVLPKGVGCFDFATVTCLANKNEYENQLSNQILIFPNPSSSKITIQGIPSGYTRLDMIDYLGRIISTETINQVEITKDYTDVSSGIYVLNFSGDGRTTLRKRLEIN